MAVADTTVGDVTIATRPTPVTAQVDGEGANPAARRTTATERDQSLALSRGSCSTTRAGAPATTV